MKRSYFTIIKCRSSGDLKKYTGIPSTWPASLGITFFVQLLSPVAIIKQTLPAIAQPKLGKLREPLM